MSEVGRSEREVWDGVKEMLGDERIPLGGHWSFNLLNDPKRLAFVLSRYKFAAKMAGKGRRILELGCSEGIGTPIVAEFAHSYTGVDLDADAIRTAKHNWGGERVHFIEADFLGKHLGEFDYVVSLDVVEHIMPDVEHRFFEAVVANLHADGIAVIGTPNATSAAYASAASQAGHVNLFDHKRLRTTMERHFHNVFLFSMNDEIVHTGYAPMAHFLFAVACNKKAS